MTSAPSSMATRRFSGCQWNYAISLFETYFQIPVCNSQRVQILDTFHDLFYDRTGVFLRITSTLNNCDRLRKWYPSFLLLKNSSPPVTLSSLVRKYNTKRLTVPQPMRVGGVFRIFLSVEGPVPRQQRIWKDTDILVRNLLHDDNFST
jgi:hypothetical protein